MQVPAPPIHAARKGSRIIAHPHTHRTRRPRPLNPATQRTVTLVPIHMPRTNTTTDRPRLMSISPGRPSVKHQIVSHVHRPNGRSSQRLRTLHLIRHRRSSNIIIPSNKLKRQPSHKIPLRILGNRRMVNRPRSPLILRLLNINPRRTRTINVRYTTKYRYRNLRSPDTLRRNVSSHGQLRYVRSRSSTIRRQRYLNRQAHSNRTITINQLNNRPPPSSHSQRLRRISINTTRRQTLRYRPRIRLTQKIIGRHSHDRRPRRRQSIRSRPYITKTVQRPHIIRHLRRHQRAHTHQMRSHGITMPHQLIMSPKTFTSQPHSRPTVTSNTSSLLNRRPQFRVHQLRLDKIKITRRSSHKSNINQIKPIPRHRITVLRLRQIAARNHIRSLISPYSRQPRATRIHHRFMSNTLKQLSLRPVRHDTVNISIHPARKMSHLLQVTRRSRPTKRQSTDKIIQINYGPPSRFPLRQINILRLVSRSSNRNHIRLAPRLNNITRRIPHPQRRLIRKRRTIAYTLLTILPRTNPHVKGTLPSNSLR